MHVPIYSVWFNYNGIHLKVALHGTKHNILISRRDNLHCLLLEDHCDPVMTYFSFDLHIAGKIERDMETIGLDTSPSASYGKQKITI